MQDRERGAELLREERLLGERVLEHLKDQRKAFLRQQKNRRKSAPTQKSPKRRTEEHSPRRKEGIRVQHQESGTKRREDTVEKDKKRSEGKSMQVVLDTWYAVGSKAVCFRAAEAQVAGWLEKAEQNLGATYL